ncbi:hypothetical protein U1Q18_019855 [Sarracenia purpurea var. burkii]
MLGMEAIGSRKCVGVPVSGEEFGEKLPEAVVLAYEKANSAADVLIPASQRRSKGASRVRDLTAPGCLTARAKARMQPNECATIWTDFTLSIANSLYIDFADFEKFGNNVSVQNAEDEMNP